jgi:amino acid adenylation domain-containing protein
VALGAYGHQEAPFERLVEEINPERDLSRSPLFQVLMTLQNARRGELSLGGPNMAGIEEETVAAKFDLTLNLTESEEGIGGVVEYSLDLYQRETIERLARHYERVLKEMVGDAERRIREIELMSGTEREQVLVVWNETARAYPRDRATHELFEEQVQRRPEAVAVVYEEQEVSYGELNRRANRLAHYLRRLGVGPEVLVGICIDNSVETIVGFLGILKAGGAYLPIDPTSPAERLRMMLKDGEPLVVVTQERYLGVLPEFSGEIICLDRDRLLAEGQSEENPPLQARSENLAYVIYTSGSTGRPKGICITHRAINRLVINTDYVSLDSSSKVGQAANSSFDAVTFEIWGPLLAGGTVIVIKKEEALSVAELGRQLQVLKINTLFVTTALFNEMARLVPESLSNLETLLFGGEAVEPRWVEEVLEKGSPERLLHVYGPTESTTFATWHEVDRVEEAARSVPIGRPIANTEVYLLDGGFEPVPDGVTGEIYLGGDGLARGYLGRPEHTAERFVPHPFREGGMRLYRTGDLGRRDADGNIEFLGRMDWQVKLRGFRIELQEIEAVLSEHRSVKQCIVVAGDDEGRGKRLLAYVVGEAEVTALSLKGHLRERLPEYMVPESITMLEEMPLTANGKIDRGRLPAPADARQSMEGSPVYPRDLLEFKLLQVWESVLGVHPIGVKDNFFDLGGHSLLALRLMAGIRSAVGRELPLSALFLGGTVERMAAILRRDASSISWSCLVELQASGSRSPLFLIHPAGGNVLCFSDLARRLGSDRPVYGIQTPGLYGERPLYTRIEDMAAHYIEAMKTVQPEGPYLLGGWSLGGIVAYEMAQQLAAQGQRIRHLLMLDSAINGVRRENVGRDEETPDDEDAQDAEILMGTINGHLPISLEELQRLHGDERIDFILKKAISMNFLPPDFEVAQARQGLTVFKTNLRAMAQYVPQVYSGAVTLFRTAEWLASPPFDEPSKNGQMLDATRDPTMGWGELAARGVQIIDVPGEHATMLNYPHVETLARRITAHIDDTRATPE